MIRSRMKEQYWFDGIFMHNKRLMKLFGTGKERGRKRAYGLFKARALMFKHDYYNVYNDDVKFSWDLYRFCSHRYRNHD